MSALTFCLGLLAVISSTNAYYSYNTEYMSEMCSQVSSDSVISAIYLKGGNKYGSGYLPGTCIVTLKAFDFGSRLIINFKKLDLYPSDELEVFDGSSTRNPKLGYTMNGADSNPGNGYRSSGRYLTIRLYSPTGDRNSYGFSAVVTEFHSGSCEWSEFKCCSNDDCIGYSLKDDGEKNCIDNSDEWAVSSCMSVGSLTGAVLGAIFGAVIVITIISVVCCQISRRNRAAATVAGATAVTQTVTHYSQGSGSYPGAGAYPIQNPYPAQSAYPGPNQYPPQATTYPAQQTAYSTAANYDTPQHSEPPPDYNSVTKST